jgi:hypothetical protein
VDFSVAKASPTEAAATSNLLSAAVLAKALILSGVQRANFYAAMEKAALAVAADGGTVGGSVSEEDARVLAEIEALKKNVVAKLPAIKKSGNTTVVATVERVAFVSGAAAEAASKVA